MNSLYLEALLETFAELNSQVLFAINGKEAVDICKKNTNIDLVLMDLKMPIMNGFEATEIIKKLRKDLPIIAQTAYSTIETKKETLLSGCDNFITKPINADALKKMIYTLLKINKTV